MGKIRGGSDFKVSTRFFAHKTRKLPSHSWESHPLTHKGEANKAFVIVAVVIISIVTLSVLLLFGKQFVGKATGSVICSDSDNTYTPNKLENVTSYNVLSLKTKGTTFGVNKSSDKTDIATDYCAAPLADGSHKYVYEYYCLSSTEYSKWPATCPTGTQCKDGTCVISSCVPNCTGKNCGLDGCGGVCGTNNGMCGVGEACNNGVCEEKNVPQTCTDPDNTYTPYGPYKYNQSSLFVNTSITGIPFLLAYPSSDTCADRLYIKEMYCMNETHYSVSSIACPSGTYCNDTKAACVESNCIDDLDNDADQEVDCDDSDCKNTSSCIIPVIHECNDTDSTGVPGTNSFNESSKFVFGKEQFGIPVGNYVSDKDFCVNSTTVSEVYCSNTTHYNRTDLHCGDNYVCDKGVCIPKPDNMCIDPDQTYTPYQNGHDITFNSSSLLTKTEVKGMINGTFSAKNDSCSSNYDSVIEVYCNNITEIGWNGWKCPDFTRCFNGACVESNCTDGLDNDHDNQVDCADSDCSKEVACGYLDLSCTPQCFDKECGPNGCGGSCGSCSSTQTCNSSGQCVSSIKPLCSTETYDKDKDTYPNTQDFDNCDTTGLNPEIVDCNDTNEKVWENITVFRDFDRDGDGGVASPPKVFCTNGSEPGYSKTNTDCFDTNKTKVCEPGKKCVLEGEKCEWICDGCPIGHKQCAGNFLETCKEEYTYCTRWDPIFCGQGMQCSVSSGEPKCVSDLYCSSNKDCLNKGGLCQEGICAKLATAGENITISMINPGGLTIQDIAKGIVSGSNYLVQIQIVPTVDLPAHYVKVSLVYDNVNTNNGVPSYETLQEYWTLQPSITAKNLEVVTFNHKVLNKPGNVKIKVQVFNQWSPLQNLDLMPSLESVYEIY